MAIKTIIIDDEQHASDALKAMLQAEFENIVEVCGVCCNATDGKNQILKKKPQLIFLDIEMPAKTGLEMLSEIADPEFEVIFTTAHEEYAISAIKLNALDYLLKPYSIKELRYALEKCIKRVEGKVRSINDYIKLYESLKPETRIKKIALNTGKLIEFIETSQIINIEANRSYSEFTLANGSKIMVSKPLKEYEEILSPYGFFRVHNSYLINLQHVKGILNEDDTVLMYDNTKICISRRKKQELIDALKSI